eukprot:TRINITY_DN6609_c0_g1_i2.p1 TRINITY_DN6609_c0_g1~~TRINITY_DN6609_c0_g1_i2.p1  ORF type:complete len:404 (+),score=104.55 TRINITY_DN6609_c0_g1_i2:669-1880(+)
MDRLRRFCEATAARLDGQPWRAGVLVTRVLSSVTQLVSMLEAHEAGCKVCGEPAVPVPTRSYCSPRRGNLPTGGEVVPVVADTPSAVAKPPPGRGEGWKVQPAPPPPVPKAKVFLRTRGEVETEEFTSPVYVDVRGRRVHAAKSAAGSSAGASAAPAALNPAAVTFGFLNRLGNRMGVVPDAAHRRRRRTRRSTSTDAGALVAAGDVDVTPPREPAPPVADASPHAATPKHEATASAGQRCAQVRLKRRDADEALGLILTKALVLKGLAKGSVAGRCGIEHVVGWKLVRVGKAAVASLPEAEALLENKRALDLTFRMPARTPPAASPYAAPPMRAGDAALPDLSKTDIDRIPPKTIFQMLSQYKVTKPKVVQQPQTARAPHSSRGARRRQPATAHAPQSSSLL